MDPEESCKDFLKHVSKLDAKSALTQTRQFLSSKRPETRQFNPTHSDIIKLHIAHCITLRTEVHLKSAFLFYRSRTEHLQSSLLGDILLFSQAKCDEALTAASNVKLDHDAIVSQLTHVPVKELAARRSIEVAVAFYLDVTRGCLNVIGNLPRYEVYYQLLAQRAFDVFAKHQRRQEVNILSDIIRRHRAHSFGDREHRLVISGNDEAMRANLQTKHTQLRTLIGLHLWNNVVQNIQEFREIVRAFKTWQKPPKYSDLATHYELLSDVFLVAENYAFHAFASVQRAMLRIRTGGGSDTSFQQLANQACLAALCIYDSGSTQRIDFQHQRDTALILAKAFDQNTPPTRTHMLSRLYKPTELGQSLFDLASPEVRVLVGKLTNPNSVLICRDVQPTLEAIRAIPALAMYEAPLRQVAVRSMIRVIAKAFSSMHIDHFCQLCPFYDRAKFATELEPMLLETAPEAGVTLAIDVDRGELRFGGGAGSGDGIVSIQGFIAHQLSLASTHCHRKTIVPPAFPKSVVDDIEKERVRLLTRNTICQLRLDGEEARKMEKQRELLEKKREDVRRKVEEEQKRIQKQRDAERGKLVKQIQEAEGVERRRWVLKALRQKYKGLVISDSLATHAQDKFANEVTAILVSFRRAAELTKESDIRLMDHYERSYRETEIPLRKAREEALAETTRQEQLKRRENLLKKQQEDHVRAVQVKARLLPLAEHKAHYEKDLSDFLNKQLSDKNRKRDEEQRELDRMMRERELKGGGGAAAAPPPTASPAPASSDSATPPPTSSPPPQGAPSSYATAGDSATSEGAAQPARWVPKSKQQKPS